MARVVDEASKVIGAKISGSKIGGDVDDAILLFPDPIRWAPPAEASAPPSPPTRRK